MINQVAIAPGDRTALWINQCCPEWSVKPLKYMTKINAKSLREDTESYYEINYIDINSVDSNGQQNPAETMTFGDAPSRARRVISSGDVIISTVRTYLKAISYIENGNDNLICSTGFAVITPSPQVHPKFLFYWVRSEWFVNEIVARSVGVSYPAINAIEIGNLPFPAIPIDEQQAIADFLDRETARIDELIARNQRLIDLLQEQRTALITHAVTKGLNPDAPMKDSGVEWLGEIPAHWEVKKIKWDTPVFRGASPRPIDDPIYFDDEGEYAWVRIADVTASGMYLENTTQQLSELGASLSVKMKPGELFLSIAGSVGKPCIARIKCCIHDGFVYFPKLSCNTKFLYYTFASGEPYKGLGKLGTQLNLNTDTVASIYIGFPPSEEQQAIADFLGQETSRIDSLVGRINQAIEKLQEYRTVLITAAVTGKIDVRQQVS